MSDDVSGLMYQQTQWKAGFEAGYKAAQAEAAALVGELVFALNGLKKISTVIYDECIVDGKVVYRTTIGDLYESYFLDADDALTKAQAFMEGKQ